MKTNIGTEKNPLYPVTPDSWPARIGVGALSSIYKSLVWVHGCLDATSENQKIAKHHVRAALREIADAVSWLTR